MSIYGWVGISTSLIYAFLYLGDKHEKHLELKNEKISSLLRVLLHDISNSIYVIKNSQQYPEKLEKHSNTNHTEEQSTPLIILEDPVISSTGLILKSSPAPSE